jgi:hypothetical protein
VATWSGDDEMESRIMYIERKAGDITGPGRIGRVTFSKSGKSVYYGGRAFQTLAGRGFKANYFDVETGEEYWISGCKRNGGDRLYGGTVDIDEDVAEEYWATIREKSQRKGDKVIRESAKYPQ